jgi:hypothetical protein
MAIVLSLLFPQVEVYHEHGHSRIINILTNAHLDNLVPKGLLTKSWQLLKSHELTACKTEFFIEVSAHLYGLVVVAPDLYPELKVVHIVRDPRDYVRSHLNWTRHRFKSFAANYLTPFWQPNPFLLKEMTLRQWLALSKFEQFCWVWTFKNQDIETLENSQVPYLRLNFEDLFGGSEPNAYLNQMLRFIGLREVDGKGEGLKRPMNVTKTRSFPAWQDWKPEHCARLAELCGSTMRRYGYGKEEEWIEKVSVGRDSGLKKVPPQAGNS